MGDSGKIKRPAFQFYAGDYLSDYNVVCMNMAQRGIYITLLAHSWLEEGIPDNDEKIRRLCGTPTEWEDDWNVVKECFELVDGKLVNPRMERERQKQIERSEKARINGALGGRVKQTLSKRKANAKQTLNSSIEVEVEDEFEVFWKEWSKTGRKADKKRARTSYVKALKTDKHKNIMIGLKKQVKFWLKTKKETKYIPHASTWINGERWNDDIQEADSLGAVIEKKEYTYTCDRCKSQLVCNERLLATEKTCDCGGELLTKFEYKQMIADKQPKTDIKEEPREKSEEEKDFFEAFGGLVTNMGA
jgi:uncharacterized protein YdaU (DUF1376 family)